MSLKILEIICQNISRHGCSLFLLYDKITSIYRDRNQSIMHQCEVKYTAKPKNSISDILLKASILTFEKSQSTKPNKCDDQITFNSSSSSRL